MAVIGFEGTAHTAGVGIVDDDGAILSNVIKMYRPDKGGIHPRKAADHHAEVFESALRQAMEEAGIVGKDITAVAFSQGPGLGPCLRVTATAARSASLVLGVPLIGVNHCVAHLEVGRLCGAVDPVLLYASGGNTQVIAYVVGRYRVLGETLDIGIGNMLDKLGISMGMRFPAAPVLEKMAMMSDELVPLPYSVKGMDVAFSGILTASQSTDAEPADIANSVQETAYAMLTEVTERALAHTGKTEVLLGGGVAQNKRLVEMAGIMCRERGARLYVPEPSLLRDNGAMIAYTGMLMARDGFETPLDQSQVDQRFRVDDVDINRTWDGGNVHVGKDEEGRGECRGCAPVPSDFDLIKIGAEASIYAFHWQGLPSVAKRREGKGYRHPDLDELIRKKRTRHEARMLAEVKRLGIRTPYIYDVDEATSTIVMEYIEGRSLRDALVNGTAGEVELAEFGSQLARLHHEDLTHGDPTTSNVILSEEMTLIDLSLGVFQASDEEKAVDLRLAREMLESTHPSFDFDAILQGYGAGGNTERVIEQLEELEGRGRYRKR